MEEVKGWQAQTFGNWDFTHHMDSLWNHDEQPPPANSTCHRRRRQKLRHAGGGGREQQRKQVRIFDVVTESPPPAMSVAPARSAMAVDEDLYKIPAELLYYRKPIKKRPVMRFLSGCLSLACLSC